MSSNYKTKAIALVHKGKTIDRVVKHDLDRVYLTDNTGDINVYYDSKVVIKDRHQFIIGRQDSVAKGAKKMKGKPCRV